MAAIVSRMPDVRFDIYTRVPRWFFEGSLRGGFSYHSLVTDVGLVQETALEADISATVRALREFLPFDERRITELAARLQKMHTDLVMCDIAPLGIAAARTAGIPSLLIENFTWDWIYEAYRAENAGIEPYIRYLRDRFAEADHHVQTEPICNPSDVDITVPPIRRSPRASPEVIRRQLDIPLDASVVLITMGGVPWQYTFLEYLASYPDVYFVVPGVAASRPAPENVRLLPRDADVYHPDLIEASDVVIGKAGYSTVAEVYHAGLPFGYVLRPAFRESSVMEAFIEEHMYGIALEAAAFADGRWLRRLSALLALPRTCRRRPNGDEEVAGYVQDVLGGGSPTHR